MTRVVAIIAARDEAKRVGATVAAVRRLPEVSEVVVVDDASRDATAALAATAGARVLVAPRHLGKGGVVEGALRRLGPADVWLLLDADLGSTANEAAGLLAPVLAGEADVAIGSLPRQEGHGGFRLVKRLSARVIRRLSGFVAAEPMSGQRCLTGAAMEAVRPLAPGFALETAMTVDAVRSGLRVVEVPVGMSHAATGRDLRGILHRARQGIAVVRAGVSRIRR